MSTGVRNGYSRKVLEDCSETVCLGSRLTALLSTEACQLSGWHGWTLGRASRIN
jgi:hypothetical protein